MFAICHQVPNMLQVMHNLGLFDYWHIWNITTNGGRMFCQPWHTV